MIMLTENAVAAVKTALSGAARLGPLPSRPGNSHSYGRGSRQ